MSESPAEQVGQGLDYIRKTYGGSKLAAALAAVQGELPVIPKTKTAEVRGVNRQGERFAYSYKYADLADISAAVMPLMAKNGLSFSCQPGLREDGKYGLEYQLLHESGELLDGFYLLDASLPIQQRGGEITYARRYCLCAVVGIAAEEDTDGQGAQQGQPPEGRRKPQAPAEGVVVNVTPPEPETPAEPPPGPDPEVQALADLAFAYVSKGKTVAELETDVYQAARAHRGWLTSTVLHPLSGQATALSVTIREAKSLLEARGEARD